jgi:hypothetical protein
MCPIPHLALYKPLERTWTLYCAVADLVRIGNGEMRDNDGDCGGAAATSMFHGKRALNALIAQVDPNDVVKATDSSR